MGDMSLRGSSGTLVSKHLKIQRTVFNTKKIGLVYHKKVAMR